MKIAVVGAGKLGLTLAQALLGGENEVTLIDKDAEVLQKASAKLDILTFCFNAKDPEELKQIKPGTYDFLIAVTNDDEKNFVIARIAKKLGCPRVIARSRDPEFVNQLDFIKNIMDIDYIVNPDQAIAGEIDRYLVKKYNLGDGLFSSGSVSIIQFAAEKLPQIINKKISTLSGMFDKTLIIAISRAGKIIVPSGDTEILQGDSIYFLGEKQVIYKLGRRVCDKENRSALKNVMIAGGGKTGYYLAKALSAQGLHVKLVELDGKRCEYLSQHLDGVLVLHGDATDISLLDDEGLDDSDAFVAVTGFDEENLLLSLVANERNIEDVVAKISRRSYGDLIERLGVSMALNPLDITSSNILRFIQGSSVIFSKVIQGQAEFIEIVADKGMKLINVPLAEHKLPQGILIAAIYRGTETIIPNGSTQIKEGDHVVICCLLSLIPELEKLIQSKNWRLLK